MAVKIQVTLFWVMTLCSDVTLKMETAWTSKTLASCYFTTLCHNPEDCNLKNHAVQPEYKVSQPAFHLISLRLTPYEQSPYCEATNLSASQEIPHLLQYPRAHYYTQGYIHSFWTGHLE